MNLIHLFLFISPLNVAFVVCVCVYVCRPFVCLVAEAFAWRKSQLAPTPSHLAFGGLPLLANDGAVTVKRYK